MTIDENALKVSNLFDIRQTSWGGRACFSNRDLKKGDVVLRADSFMGTSISHEFRKEVCHYCFGYNSGKPMKVKLDPLMLSQYCDGEWCIKKKGFNGAGLWFCSGSCLEKYLQVPNIIELVVCYESLLAAFNMMNKSKKTALEEQQEEEQLNNITISDDIIEQTWDDIRTNWIPMFNKTKVTKRQKYLTRISDDVYACCRFVAETLFKLKYLDPNSDIMESFLSLQSNESLKMARFPILLQFQITVFKTLKVVLPEPYKDMLTIPLFRHILGSEYGNAFGIWEERESVDSREYLGYWVFPQASYFNHTCDPNVTKSKEGRSMVFTLNRDVSAGDELNIDYSGLLDLSVIERRNALKESWFFLCQCERCQSDLKLVH